MLGVLAVALLIRLGVQQRFLKWGLQYYLGDLLHGRVTIGGVQGGFFSSLHLADLRLYHPSSPTPLLSVEEITTDFRLLGGIPSAKHCVLSHPRIFFRECAGALGDFSLPLERPILPLPGGSFWRAANFSMINGQILESANRQDNVLLHDLVGSIIPRENQTLELLIATAKTSATQNRLNLYGTLPLAKADAELDISLELAKLEELNLFLRSFHILSGFAKLDARIRSSHLESAQVTFQDVEVFSGEEARILRKLEGKLFLSEQYVSLRDCRAEGKGVRLEVSADAEKISFSHGKIAVPRLLGKLQLLDESLSSRPIAMNLESSLEILYRHASTMAQLERNGEVAEYLSTSQGKLNFNGIADLIIRLDYAAGQPFVLDYRIASLDVEKIRKDWFSDKLGDLFGAVTVRGEGRADCQWDRILLEGRLDWDGNALPYLFVWQDRKLQLQDVRIGEATKLQGVLDIVERQNSSLSFQFQNESMMRVLHTLGPDRKTSLTGKFTGNLDFQGDMLDPTIRGLLHLTDGTLRGIPFREGEIRLAGKLPRIFLDQSVIYVRKDMPVVLSGFIDLTQKDVFKNVASGTPSRMNTPGVQAVTQ